MKITPENLTPALEAVVAEKGADYIYPSSERDPLGRCQYIIDNRPSCLFGAAFVRLGVDLVVITSHEGEHAAMIAGDVNGEDLNLNHFPFSRAIQEAQSVQDNDGTWGDALTTYKKELGL